jgi:uncharacterized protein
MSLDLASRPATNGFSVMAKPIGPVCNLDCSYCYYVRKNELYDRENPRARMTEAQLEGYIRDYFISNPAPVVTFAWQGGEPTLLGLDYFRKVVEFQHKHCPPGKRWENAFQTNGTLLDDDWCRFFKANNFLIGLSVDGPAHIHDGYRIDKGEKPTHHLVMRGLALLKKHGVEFNTLTTVHRKNQKHGAEVYEFLARTAGSQHLQFIPIVERRLKDGRDAGAPKLTEIDKREWELAPETVTPGAYGQFLCDIFDAWIARDVGKVYVYAFETVLSQMVRGFAGICVHERTCGDAVVVERDGGIYSCDHFVYNEFRLGTIAEQTLGELMDSPRQRQFGRDKEDKLPGQCRRCPVREFCNGGCPKHRFAVTEDGEPGLNHLCPGYFKFFSYVKEPLTLVADLLRQGKDPADVMKQWKQRRK